jgi:hypothetical protein
MSTLRVYANDVVDWVIASSPEDADAVCREHTGDTDDDPHNWTVCADDHVLPIHTDDGTIEKTCAEWVAEHGRGFLCSTEY